ncbi:unnamed protein product [Hermetia illucens]|uniref:NADP-dependent oxidoreductase domain-containing protein n=1 Tax=Hermetia illucens TaxID=343691 RepID=A0A7R8ULZ6_HERIL|nr:1,5-anhydro-D-fructose reductase [Hermetia illucens]CAD7083074.1 unnamed protein product [Hermetia illucens]
MVLAVVPKVKLNDGSEMPVLGLGTYLAKDDEVQKAVSHAIDVGYRHIDTALYYRNEADIGEVIREKIKQGVVKREDLFIVTKLWNSYHDPERVEYACRKSLENLGLDYIDLYLMHHPVGYIYVDDNNLRPTYSDEKLMLNDVDYLDTYKAMEKLVKKGLTKSIGVSNFNKEQLERIIQFCKIRPVTNQVECNPGINQKKLIKYCRDHGITVTAYAPLGRPIAKEKIPTFLFDDIILSIANKHKKTPAQVILRYLIDINTIPIPKSTNPERIEENIKLFDFKLNNDEIELIDSLNTGNRLYQFPLMQDHKYYPFKAEY